MSATTDSIAKQVSLLTVTPEEWAAANDYFQKYPAENKYSKKPNVNLEHKGSPHSFIKVGEKIYAMANGQYVGEGEFGKVKVVQAEDGTNFALKIEGVASQESNQEAQKVREDIATALKFFEGSVTRKFEKSKPFKIGTKSRKIMRKVYTVMPYLSGNNLWREIKGNKNKNFSDRDKLQIALQCAKAIKVLHDKGIVHADIKPQNFMINREGGVIIVKAIDFDASQKLGSEGFVEVGAYTKSYAAPEVKDSLENYSFKADIYSLGVTLHFLKFSGNSKNITDKVIGKMRSKNLWDRVSIDDVIEKLEKNLKLLDELDRCSQSKKIEFNLDSVFSGNPSEWNKLINAGNINLINLLIENGLVDDKNFQMLLNNNNKDSIKKFISFEDAVAQKNVELVNLLLRNKSIDNFDALGKFCEDNPRLIKEIDFDSVFNKESLRANLIKADVNLVKLFFEKGSVSLINFLIKSGVIDDEGLKRCLGNPMSMMGLHFDSIFNGESSSLWISFIEKNNFSLINIFLERGLVNDENFKALLEKREKIPEINEQLTSLSKKAFDEKNVDLINLFLKNNLIEDNVLKKFCKENPMLIRLLDINSVFNGEQSILGKVILEKDLALVNSLIEKGGSILQQHPDFLKNIAKNVFEKKIIIDLSGDFSKFFIPSFYQVAFNDFEAKDYMDFLKEYNPNIKDALLDVCRSGFTPDKTDHVLELIDQLDFSACYPYEKATILEFCTKNGVQILEKLINKENFDCTLFFHKERYLPSVWELAIREKNVDFIKFLLNKKIKGENVVSNENFKKLLKSADIGKRPAKPTF